MTMARALPTVGSLALLLVSSAAAPAADTRTVADSTGRRVEVPVRIVYGVEVAVTEATRADGRVARVCIPTLGPIDRP